MNETRQQLIDRLIGDREKRIAAEAERYKDKRMDEPNPPVGPNTPGVVAIKYLIGNLVRFRLTPVGGGVVVGIDIRPTGTIYQVCWDTRETSPHYDFELEAVGDDGPCSDAAY